MATKKKAQSKKATTDSKRGPADPKPKPTPKKRASRHWPRWAYVLAGCALLWLAIITTLAVLELTLPPEAKQQLKSVIDSVGSAVLYVLLAACGFTAACVCWSYAGAKWLQARHTYDDGSDVNSTHLQSEAAKERLLRRQHVEAKRAAAAVLQQQREEEEWQQYQEWLQREHQRRQQELERLERAFEKWLESQVAQEFKRQEKAWEQWQKQQQQRQGFRTGFEGRMGFGPQNLPAGCEGTVKEVLLAADYYQVLQMDRSNIGDQSLKAARRARALAVHPDKVGPDCPGANEAGGRVNLAYEALSDPTMRQEYDAWLATQQQQKRGKRSKAAAR